MEKNLKLGDDVTVECFGTIKEIRLNAYNEKEYVVVGEGMYCGGLKEKHVFPMQMPEMKVESLRIDHDKVGLIATLALAKDFIIHETSEDEGGRKQNLLYQIEEVLRG